jgi:hypothetical protein
MRIMHSAFGCRVRSFVTNARGGLVISFGLVALFASGRARADEAATPPNIVFIMADENALHGWSMGHNVQENCRKIPQTDKTGRRQITADFGCFRAVCYTLLHRFVAAEPGCQRNPC